MIKIIHKSVKLLTKFKRVNCEQNQYRLKKQ